MFLKKTLLKGLFSKQRNNPFFIDNEVDKAFFISEKFLKRNKKVNLAAQLKSQTQSLNTTIYNRSYIL